MIPKELYKTLPDEVKVIMQQHHAYYIDKYGKGGGGQWMHVQDKLDTLCCVYWFHHYL